MDAQEFQTAVTKLERSLVDAQGDLRLIGRIEFEPLGSQIRWTIWEDTGRLHSLTATAADLPGLLTATKLLLEMDAAQRAELQREIAHHG